MSQNASQKQDRRSAPTSEHKPHEPITDVSADDGVGVPANDPTGKPPSTAPEK